MRFLAAPDTASSDEAEALELLRQAQEDEAMALKLQQQIDEEEARERTRHKEEQDLEVARQMQVSSPPPSTNVLDFWGMTLCAVIRCYHVCLCCTRVQL